MQPQDGGFDWTHGITSFISVAFGAISGFAASIWRIARIEPTIREDFKATIDDAERRVEEKIETLVSQIHETFSAIRQKINDVELGTARGFIAKSDFDDFKRELREELREQFRDLRGSFSEALKRKPQ